MQIGNTHILQHDRIVPIHRDDRIGSIVRGVVDHVGKLRKANVEVKLKNVVGTRSRLEIMDYIMAERTVVQIEDKCVITTGRQSRQHAITPQIVIAGTAVENIITPLGIVLQTVPRIAVKRVIPGPAFQHVIATNAVMFETKSGIAVKNVVAVSTVQNIISPPGIMPLMAGGVAIKNVITIPPMQHVISTLGLVLQTGGLITVELIIAI